MLTVGDLLLRVGVAAARYRAGITHHLTDAGHRNRIG